MNIIVLLSQCTTYRHKFEANDAQTALLETVNNVACQTALYGVRLMLAAHLVGDLLRRLGVGVDGAAGHLEIEREPLGEQLVERGAGVEREHRPVAGQPDPAGGVGQADLQQDDLVVLE